jgi:tRNA dimethylallyltransferase
VISADSRQVFRGMDVGTAKPALAERRGVPHHGLDLVDPDVAYSVADFVEHADGVLADLAARGGVAVLVGGTGFWIRAVAAGIAPTVPWVERAGGARRSRPRRCRSDRASSSEPPASPRPPTCNRGAWCERSDRGAARRPLPAPRGYPGRVLRIGLDVPDHAVHRAWIAQRAAAQLDGGILPEAASLRARFEPGLPAFSAIGYREAWDLLDGRLDRASYLEVNVRRNVAFARQRTWFRREPADLALDAADLTAAAAAVAAALAFVAT